MCARSARNQGNVKAFLAKKAARLRLIEAAVLRFRDPIELNGDFRARFLRGRDWKDADGEQQGE